jgi:hypothetical protein
MPKGQSLILRQQHSPDRFAKLVSHVHIDPRTDTSPSTPIICRLWVILQFFDPLVKLFDHFFLSDLYSLSAKRPADGLEISYLQHKKRGFSILHTSKIQEFAIGFIATLVANFHALEDGCIQHHPMHVLGSHDHTRLPLELWCFFVRTFFEFETNIDLQVANTTLLPFSVLEVVEFRSTFDHNFFILFTSLT